jgi:TPR repeat protein
LERAAELGDRYAIVLVEVGRVSGRFGVPLDKERGLQTLRQMAADGWMEAQFEFGALLADGKYVQRDMEQAKALLEKASLQGHGGAERALKVIQKKFAEPERK